MSSRNKQHYSRPWAELPARARLDRILTCDQLQVDRVFEAATQNGGRFSSVTFTLWQTLRATLVTLARFTGDREPSVLFHGTRNPLCVQSEGLSGPISFSQLMEVSCAPRYTLPHVYDDKTLWGAIGASHLCVRRNRDRVVLVCLVFEKTTRSTTGRSRREVVIRCPSDDVIVLGCFVLSTSAA